MQTTAEIFDALTQLLRDVFDDDRLVAVPELTAMDVNGWDSLAHIRLVVSVERHFKVRFSASEVNNLKNVGEFANLIQSKL